ncbi:plasmid mobilization relaxosome protein MobC [Aeromonas veronii]|uniref:plasmid mobilization relaxosome protein MobC n=1 Tax=Aeromonas veronii TaxID=654 RepID=UPI001130EE1B|nr:plasmid mobilization relaxosome protein MobC [Aeromonas veronii]
MKPQDGGRLVLVRFYEPGGTQQMSKKNKDVIVSFRLSSAEFEPFEKEMIRLGMSKSKYFNLLVTGKLEESLASGHNTKDYKKLLFFVNKASNNINQIAKRLNVESKGGAIKEATYIKAMNALISIRDSLLSVIK